MNSTSEPKRGREDRSCECPGFQDPREKPFRAPLQKLTSLQRPREPSFLTCSLDPLSFPRPSPPHSWCRTRSPPYRYQKVPRSLGHGTRTAACWAGQPRYLDLGPSRLSCLPTTGQRPPSHPSVVLPNKSTGPWSLTPCEQINNMTYGLPGILSFL